MEVLTIMCILMLSINKYLLVILLMTKKKQCMVFFPKVNMTGKCGRPRAACLLR